MCPNSGFPGRLFGLAALPSRVRRTLEDEGLLFLQEGVRITVAYRKFRAPGKYFSGKTQVTWGALGVSRGRIIGYALRKRVLHLPFDDHRLIQAVKFSLVERKVLVISADQSAVAPNRSGLIELRYHMEAAPEAFSVINGLIGS